MLNKGFVFLTMFVYLWWWELTEKMCYITNRRVKRDQKGYSQNIARYNFTFPHPNPLIINFSRKGENLRKHFSCFIAQKRWAKFEDRHINDRVKRNKVKVTPKLYCDSSVSVMKYKYHFYTIQEYYIKYYYAEHDKAVKMPSILYIYKYVCFEAEVKQVSSHFLCGGFCFISIWGVSHVQLGWFESSAPLNWSYTLENCSCLTDYLLNIARWSYITIRVLRVTWFDTFFFKLRKVIDFIWRSTTAHTIKSTPVRLFIRKYSLKRTPKARS